MTAEENPAWLARLHQGEAADLADIHGALAEVGLRGFEDIRCGSLSEGQRKRVNIARLYLVRASAWVLDEPFSAIDTSGVEKLHRRIEWQCERGGVVVLTSHQALKLNCPVMQVSLGTK